MSIKYNSSTICGPGNSARIGANGNWWVGNTDTGVPASATNSIHFVTTAEMNTATDKGVYMVTDGDYPVIWYIDTAGTKRAVVGVTPTIGSNGNWFIGTTDTGVPALAQCEILTGVIDHTEWETSDNTYYTQFVTLDIGDSYNNAIFEYVFTRDDDTLSESERTVIMSEVSAVKKIDLVKLKSTGVLVECYNGSAPAVDLHFRVIKYVPRDVNPVTNIAINDNATNTTSVWSSSKISTELNTIKDGTIAGKSLEYNWDGTKLGIRQSGYTTYNYTDLKGTTGADGSSIVTGRLDDAGNLILQLPDSAGTGDSAAGKTRVVLSPNGEMSTIFTANNTSGMVEITLNSFTGYIQIIIDSDSARGINLPVNSSTYNVITFNNIENKLDTGDNYPTHTIAFNQSIQILARCDSLVTGVTTPVVSVNYITF